MMSVVISKWSVPSERTVLVKPVEVHFESSKLVAIDKKGAM